MVLYNSITERETPALESGASCCATVVWNIDRYIMRQHLKQIYQNNGNSRNRNVIPAMEHLDYVQVRYKLAQTKVWLFHVGKIQQKTSVNLWTVFHIRVLSVLVWWVRQSQEYLRDMFIVYKSYIIHIYTFPVEGQLPADA